MIGGLIAGALVLRWFFGSPVAEAIAERIRAGVHRRRHWKGFGGEWLDVPGAGAGEGAGAVGDRRMAALEEQVSQLQGQILELGERLDFAERMLAEGRERKLGAGQ